MERMVKRGRFRLPKVTAEVGSPSEVRLQHFDPFLGDDEMRSAYRCLVEGSWSELELYVDTSPHAWMFNQAVTSEVAGIETITFERWVERSGHPMSHVLHAGAIIRDALEARSEAGIPHARFKGAETDPSDAVLPQTHRALQTAEAILYDVISSNPSLADPWVYLLQSGRATGEKLTTLRERFDNAHSRSPFRTDAVHHYLQALTKKWGGSQHSMFEFAHWVDKEAPFDAPSRGALPSAHLEQGLLADGPNGFDNYLSQSGVAAEISTSLLQFLRDSATPATLEQLWALNSFALATVPQDAASARLLMEAFTRIEDRPTLYPWTLYQEPIADVFGVVRADKLRSSSDF